MSSKANRSGSEMMFQALRDQCFVQCTRSCHCSIERNRKVLDWLTVDNIAIHLPEMVQAAVGGSGFLFTTCLIGHASFRPRRSQSCWADLSANRTGRRRPKNSHWPSRFLVRLRELHSFHRHLIPPSIGGNRPRASRSSSTKFFHNFTLLEPQ